MLVVENLRLACWAAKADTRVANMIVSIRMAVRKIDMNDDLRERPYKRYRTGRREQVSKQDKQASGGRNQPGQCREMGPRGAAKSNHETIRFRTKEKIERNRNDKFGDGGAIFFVNRIKNECQVKCKFEIRTVAKVVV